MKKRLGDIRKISGIRLNAVRTFSPFPAIFVRPIVPALANTKEANGHRQRAFQSRLFGGSSFETFVIAQQP